MRIRRNEKGLVLITVVVLTWFLFALTGSYFIILMTEKGSIFASANSLKAEAIAEAGIEEVMWKYNYDGADFSGWGTVANNGRQKTVDPFTDASGNAIGSYTVTVQNYNLLLAGVPLIVTSVGTYNVPGGAAPPVTVKAQLKPRPLFPGAMVATDQITFTGNAFTDSYDSSKGAYNDPLVPGPGVNIFQNGDVITTMENTVGAIQLGAANGNPVIAGDASTGQNSTVSHPGKVSGVVSNNTGKVIREVLPPGYTWLSPPPQDPLIPWPGTPPMTGYRIAGDLTISNGASSIQTGVGPEPNVTLWVDGNVTISGAGSMRINPGYSMVLYVSGNSIVAGGGGITNQTNDLAATQHPQSLIIYATDNCTSLVVTGTTYFVGGIKAREASITLSGTSGFYGAVIGKDITATGGGGVHFDEQFLNSPLEGEGKDIIWMRRV